MPRSTPRPAAVPAASTGTAPGASAAVDGLGLPRPLVQALAGAGVTSLFPIQASTLPDSLAGRDVLGRGRTGSGKTYAFLIPLVARLSAQPARRRAGRPRGLVLAPTRELARQIEASLAPLARAMSLRTMTVFGGVPAGPQARALAGGVDIVIACPGRLDDLVRSGHAGLDGVEITVLDEADHMADLGFLPTVRRLLDQTPADGQRLLFSATLDAGVDVLVRRYLTAPVTHSVDSAQSPVATMEHHVLHVGTAARLPVIAGLAAAPGRTLIFTRTKFGAKALARKLSSAGVPAVDLHGNLSQNARTRNLAEFASGTVSTLVATDIAARGIHVDDVTLVIHADPPIEHKAYLHRSGRTARAGATGTVVTMMLDAQTQAVRDLTRKAGVRPVITRVDADHPLLRTLAPGERTYTHRPAAEPAPQRGGDSSGGGRTRTRRRSRGRRHDAVAAPNAPARTPRRSEPDRAVTTAVPAPGSRAAQFSARGRRR